MITVNGTENDDEISIYSFGLKQVRISLNSDRNTYVNENEVLLYGFEGDDNFHLTTSLTDLEQSATGLSVSIIGGMGNDTVFGYTGYEVAIYSGTLDDYTIETHTPPPVFYENGADIWHDFETFISDMEGNEGIDQLTGVEELRFADQSLYWNGAGYGSEPMVSNGDDYFKGSSVNDRMSGLLGDDTLDGGNGQDYLEGNAGADLLRGGRDRDLLLDHFNDNSNDTLQGGRGNDKIGSVGGQDVLEGGRGDDYLFATNGAHLLLGGRGDDHLTGGHMTNEYGISTLDGGYGNDNILALGNTLITGGRGDDTFVFLYVEHATSSAPNIITDFEQGKDVIDLSALTTLSFIGTSAFAGTGGAEVRYSQTATDTIVEIDADGDATIDSEIELTGLHALIGSDFVL